MTSSRDFKIVALLLAFAMCVGGAGLSYPILGMLLQLSAVGVAVYLLLTRRRWQFHPLALAALGILGLALLLPFVQLLPLPKGVWQSLPGRELPAQLDALRGLSNSRPITLDFEATVRAILTLVPAAVIFVGCMFLDYRERQRLLWVVLAFAVFNALLGVAQLSTGGRLTPYPSGHSGYPLGLFVNRNHSAALLLAAIPIAGALGADAMRRRPSRLPFLLVTLSVMIIFAITVIGTTSRMGLLLLPLSLAAGLFLLLSRQSALKFALPSILGIAGLAWLLFATGQLNRTLIRFSSLNDPRFDYWADISWGLDKYGLAGTGIGTFVPVYKSVESLEAVTARVTNHAHNDYLEILLDGGLPAIMILLMFIVLLVAAGFRMFRRAPPPSRSAMVGAAATSLAVLMLCSFVDYPLRMPALAAVFVVLCGVVLPSYGTQAAAVGVELITGGEGAVRKPRRLPKAAGLGLLVILAIASVQAATSARELQNERYASASEWAPWSTRAHELRATEALLQNDLREARRSADAAVRLSPINAPAIRTLGMVNLAENRRPQGEQLMGVAAALGWRDPLTQLWVIQAALPAGETEKVAQRAIALFRRNIFFGPLMGTLISAPGKDDIRKRLVAELATDPSWRKGFLQSASDIPAPQAAAFLYIIADLRRTKAPVTLREMRPALEEWLNNGNVELAQRAWAMVVGRELVANPGFEEAHTRRRKHASLLGRARRRPVSNVSSRSVFRREKPFSKPGCRCVCEPASAAKPRQLYDFLECRSGRGGRHVPSGAELPRPGP
jgi:O-antigen ligase